MKRFVTAFSVLCCLILFTTFAWGQTNPTAQSLPYSQNFSGLDWTSTTYPAGWQGWTISTSPGSSFNTATPTADRTLTASSTASTTSGNVHNYNGAIGYLNTASLDLTVVLAIKTNGLQDIQVAYDIATLRNPYDGSSNTRINEVTLQYRVGTTGAFTNLSGIEYQNNTTTQTGAVTTPQNSSSKNITLPAGCNNQSVVQIRWASRQVSGAGSRPSFIVDNISVSGTAMASPVINVSSSSLSGFSYVEGSGPSASQSYNLSGSNLDPSSGNLTVTGSTNYEVSTDNSSFSSSFNVPYTGGALSNTPIYVRLKAGLSAGSYNGETISNSGGGATTVNVTCSGTVTTEEPTNHPTLFSAALGTPPHGKITFTWTDASGGIVPDGYLIKASSVGYGSISDPVDGTAESDVLLKRNATQGTQTVSFGDLSGSTTYYFKIFPYKGSGSSINYKTDGSVQQTSTTTETLYSTLLLEHNFDYSGNLSNYGWSLHSGSGTPINTTSGLSYTDYPSSGIGNAANVIGTSDDLNLGFAEQNTNGTSIYLSFLVKVTETNNSMNGSYFIHLGNRTSETNFTSHCARVYDSVDASGNVYFGLSNITVAPITYTSTSFSKNEVYLLIVKYTINTGGTDEVKLWVKSSGVPSNESNAGPADITISNQTSLDNVNAIALRQASPGIDIVVDGIRTATSWGQAPLPVEVKSISAVASKYSATLLWDVATEVNAYGYEILRREIGNKEVVTVGFVKAEGLANYSFNDINVKPGRYIYEIKQIDNDGTFKIYSSAQITVGEAARELRLDGYPNPFNPSTNIEFTLPENGFATLKIYNLIGQEVATLFNGNAEAGVYNKVSFNASKLSSGMYFSILESNGQRLVKKLMLTK